MRPFAKYVATLCVVLGTAAHGQRADPHQIYEENCAMCHAEHAGDFVFESTTAAGKGLAGKTSGRLVEDFLKAGHGKLPDAQIRVLIEQFEFIARSGRLFHDKCIICHDTAVNLARRKLILRDGVLTGRYTNRDIAQFLLGHGRLDPAEAARMVDVLSRQLELRELGIEGQN